MLIYTVKAGDTLAEICRRFEVAAAQVIAINDLSRPEVLAVGQSLILPTATHPYTVKTGETLGQIANRLGQSLQLLYADNPALRTRPLLADETIFVRQPPAKRGTLEVNGYAYPQIEAGLLERTLPYLTYLTIFSYGARADGGLVSVEDRALITAARAAGVAPVMLLSTIGEDGTFNSEVARSVLTDATLQQKLIENVAATLRQKQYAAVDVDFEFIPVELGREYAAFIENLTRAVAPAKVLVALAPKTSAQQKGLLYEAHDYALLGAAAQRALLMTYEWGYTYGPPMAVAPLDGVRSVLEYAVSAIPPEKLLMGIPNYAYDWPLPFVRGKSAARSLGNGQAALLAGEMGAEIFFDRKAASPTFTYYTDGAAHEVWFEDARSVQAKLGLVEEFKLQGVGVWNIMRPFGAMWYLLDYYYKIAKLPL